MRYGQSNAALDYVARLQASAIRAGRYRRIAAIAPPGFSSGIEMTPQGAVLMAAYNRWMNDRVFEAAGRLNDDELAADKGAFFGSILGTLNHIAVADTIWLQRFARHPAPFEKLVDMSEFPTPTSLRQTIASDLTGLRAYRSRLDELVVRWVADLTPEHLTSNLSFASMAGAVSTRSFSALLQHFFNHQTHHRGQVTTLLFQSGIDVGVTDLLMLVPNSDG